jgi:hypothetical protein
MRDDGAVLGGITSGRGQRCPGASFGEDAASPAMAQRRCSHRGGGVPEDVASPKMWGERGSSSAAAGAPACTARHASHWHAFCYTRMLPGRFSPCAATTD